MAATVNSFRVSFRWYTVRAGDGACELRAFDKYQAIKEARACYPQLFANVATGAIKATIGRITQTAN